MCLSVGVSWLCRDRRRDSLLIRFAPPFVLIPDLPVVIIEGRIDDIFLAGVFARREQRICSPVPYVQQDRGRPFC